MFHVAYIRRAEGELKIAEKGLEQALALGGKEPRDELAELRVTRARLAVEAARLALERAKDPAFLRSESEQVLWKIGQLQKDVLDLRIRLAEIQ